MSEQDVTSVREGLEGHPRADSIMNLPTVGSVLPALVVSVTDHPDHPDANLRVFFDGSGDMWATSRTEGDEPGTWCWPPRVGA
jgi:hypothetical protein